MFFHRFFHVYCLPEGIINRRSCRFFIMISTPGVKAEQESSLLYWAPWWNYGHMSLCEYVLRCGVGKCGILGIIFIYLLIFLYIPKFVGWCLIWTFTHPCEMCGRTWVLLVSFICTLQKTWNVLCVCSMCFQHRFVTFCPKMTLGQWTWYTMIWWAQDILVYRLAIKHGVLENPLWMEIFIGKSHISMVHFPARHVWLPEVKWCDSHVISPRIRMRYFDTPWSDCPMTL